MTEQPGQAPANWGRWGVDDEIGALNLITPDVRLAALATPVTGRLYTLGLPAQAESSPTIPYRGPTQRLTLASRADAAMWDAIGQRMGVPSPGTGAMEDLLITATHNGTHMDALAHVYHDDTLYNGYPADSVVTLGGARRDSIDKVGGIAGRGVLLDVAAYAGVPWLDSDARISGDLLEEVRAAQGTDIREGDILLVRTGWIEHFAEAGGDATELGQGQPGLDRSAVDFIDQYGVSVVGADNSAVECLPCDGEYLSVHVALLWARGIHLLEHLALGALGADRCHEFFLAVAPLKVVGGSGSPVNPIAIG